MPRGAASNATVPNKRGVKEDGEASAVPEVTGSLLDRIDDYLHALSIPDCLITPSQYADFRRSSSTRHDPIRRLLLAVLEDAVDIYRKYHTSPLARRRRLFGEACAWFFDEEDCDDDRHLCFATICDALGLEASALRVGLRRLHKERV